MESPNSKIIIGCDIGGVLKTLPDRILIPGAIDGVKSLSKTFKVVLISKTKKPEDPRKIIFLRENGIDFIEVSFNFFFFDQLKIKFRLIIVKHMKAK